MDGTLRFEDGRVWLSTINNVGYNFDPRLLGDFGALLTALAVAALVGLLATEAGPARRRRSPNGAAALLLMTAAAMLLMATFTAYGASMARDAVALFSLYSTLLNVFCIALLLAFLALLHLAARRHEGDALLGAFGAVFQGLYFAYAFYWSSQAPYLTAEGAETLISIEQLVVIFPAVLAAIYVLGPGLRVVLRWRGWMGGDGSEVVKWLCILSIAFISLEFALIYNGVIFLNALIGVEQFRDAPILFHILRGPLPAFVLLVLIQHAMPDLRARAGADKAAPV